MQSVTREDVYLIGVVFVNIWLLSQLIMMFSASNFTSIFIYKEFVGAFSAIVFIVAVTLIFRNLTKIALHVSGMLAVDSHKSVLYVTGVQTVFVCICYFVLSVTNDVMYFLLSQTAV